MEVEIEISRTTRDLGRDLCPSLHLRLHVLHCLLVGLSKMNPSW
jgi:hypothetical protein